MTHRNLNNCLAVFVIVLACYIVLAPFLPQLDYIFNGPSTTPKPAFVTADTKANNSGNTPAVNTPEGSIGASTPSPNSNQLYIPSIGASAAIIEGTDAHTVDKGLWHRPATSTPDLTGNMVVVGHRFSYNHGVVQPFYHLDKVKIGDSIYIQWNGKKYTYNVNSKKVVKKTETSVEAPTSFKQLTIYTCTPLWNPVDRLVLTAVASGATNE